MQFFGKAGFPCPSRRNPSDHFLRCINSDFDTVTTTMMSSGRTHVYNNFSYLLLTNSLYLTISTINSFECRSQKHWHHQQ